MRIPDCISHARRQKESVPEEAEIGVCSMICNFLHALQAFSMTASPLDAVSAAGPLCTHGKDKPGLGAPNSLKSKNMQNANSRLHFACGDPKREGP